MNDKELLQMAAKAVGYEPQQYNSDKSLTVIKGCTANCRFNPLNDDSDAFRLMVELRLEVEPDFLSKDAVYVYLPESGAVIEFGEDQYAATRRAITRAAAEIGAKL